MNEYLNALAQGANLSPATLQRRRREAASVHRTLRSVHSRVELARSVLALRDGALPQQRRDAGPLRRALHLVHSRSSPNGRLRSRPTRRSTRPSSRRETTTSATSWATTPRSSICRRSTSSGSGTGSTTAPFRPIPRRISRRRWPSIRTCGSSRQTATTISRRRSSRRSTTLNHLKLPPQLQTNISYGFYESGHMVYLHPPALAQFHDDLERWYSQTLQAGR